MCGDQMNSPSGKSGIIQPRRQSWRVVSILTVLFFSWALPSTAGEVWVANMKGANVQIIDTSSNKVVQTIPTGAGAHNVTFSPDGKLAYIANLGTNSITIIDTMSKEKLADIVTDTKAHDVAVSPDGKLAVACNVGAGNITFIDVAAKKAVHTMATGKKAITAVFSPDGKRLVYDKSKDDGHNVLELDIYVINTDGTGEKRLTNSGQKFASEPSWSSDGKSIVFFYRGKTDKQIAILRVE